MGDRTPDRTTACSVVVQMRVLVSAGSSRGRMQSTLTAATWLRLCALPVCSCAVAIYMFLVGIGTLLWGPASDKFGRRSMYLAGMVLFLGTTLGCLFAPTIEVLVAFRGLQGLAGEATPRGLRQQGRAVGQLCVRFDAAAPALSVGPSSWHTQSLLCCRRK